MPACPTIATRLSTFEARPSPGLFSVKVGFTIINPYQIHPIVMMVSFSHPVVTVSNASSNFDILAVILSSLLYSYEGAGFCQS